jgi:predicted metal-dependent enzyme (double-stranded beta helix superfamily)
MFDVDELVDSCREALAETEPRRAVREVLDRALASPDDLAEVLDPQEGGLHLLHHAPDLTVIHVVWAPGMVLRPHDHRMWAVIGIYTGAEDNAFFRRPTPDSTTLVESGGKHLAVSDTVILGDDVIHQVSNPVNKLTGAIHVYGGDFVNQPRSQWGDPPYEERPWDMTEAREQFATANAAWRSAASD